MSTPLKLITPVRSMFMLQHMLRSGVQEVYAGLKPDAMQVLSFDSRHQIVADVPAQVDTDEELAEIVQAAHRGVVKVGFMANSSLIPDGMADAFLRHVRRGVEAGVDSVSVASLHAVHLIREAGIDIPLEAGTLAGATNIGMLRLLEELGVTRVGVPQGMRLDEVREFAAQTDLEIIVTGNFGGGNVCGHCRLCESPVQEDIGQGCRSGYRVFTPEGVVHEQLPVLDGATDCNLCSLPDLVAAGVSGVKLIGREVPNPVTLAKMAEIFRYWMDEVSFGRTADDIRQDLDQGDLMWTMMWTPRFCEKKRCTYLDTPTTRAYV